MDLPYIGVQNPILDIEVSGEVNQYTSEYWDSGVWDSGNWDGSISIKGAPSIQAESSYLDMKVLSEVPSIQAESQRIVMNVI
jgi:hypothetical protein